MQGSQLTQDAKYSLSFAIIWPFSYFKFNHLRRNEKINYSPFYWLQVWAACAFIYFINFHCHKTIWLHSVLVDACTPTCDWSISWLHVRFPFPDHISPPVGETHVFLPFYFHTEPTYISIQLIYLSPAVCVWMMVCLHWYNAQTKSSSGMLNLLTRNNTQASREPSTTYQIPRERGRGLL